MNLNYAPEGYENLVKDFERKILEKSSTFSFLSPWRFNFPLQNDSNYMRNKVKYFTVVEPAVGWFGQ